jgi:glutamate-1-semialdehyde 2,1-aminomutase
MSGFAKKTPKSKELYERACQVLPSGVTSGTRALPPYPFFVEEAQGVKLSDVDGNEYTDYWVSHGALILGHSPKRVMDAVRKQLSKGTQIGFSHEFEIELAERIVKNVPSAEMVRYLSSRTEANMYGTRLARAYTGRMKMLKIEGGWNGGYDSLQKAVSYPYTSSESAGLNPKTTEDTDAVPFNDLEEAQKKLKTKKYACLILEPVLGAAGFITPKSGYLQGLREICNETDSLLIFDEAVTGFRLAPGGAQELYGVKPDLTILGNIIGGGFPIDAFCGPSEIMQHLNDCTNSRIGDGVVYSGTYTCNPISMIAGCATLDFLKDGNVYISIDKLGKRIRDGLDDILQRGKLPATITGVGSLFAIHFQAKIPKNAGDTVYNNMATTKAYFTHMLDHGIVYLSPTTCHCWISAPHTKEDIDAFITATGDFVKGYRT